MEEVILTIKDFKKKLWPKGCLKWCVLNQPLTHNHNNILEKTPTITPKTPKYPHL